MTEQLKTPPTHFDVQKYWGPFFANITLADDVTNALIKMTDKIIDDKKSESHGQSLAGVIDKEMRVYKSDMEKAGVDQLIESCVKSYVVHCAKQHNFFSETHTFQSSINSAWIVSQYENEYNPMHNHTGCDISAVIYLKTPDVKGRRNIESKKRTILYSVKQGDNLYKISELFDVSVKSIKDINKFKDETLRPGQIIKIAIRAF